MLSIEIKRRRAATKTEAEWKQRRSWPPDAEALIEKAGSQHYLKKDMREQLAFLLPETEHCKLGEIYGYVVVERTTTTEEEVFKFAVEDENLLPAIVAAVVGASIGGAK